MFPLPHLPPLYTWISFSWKEKFPVSPAIKELKGNEFKIKCIFKRWEQSKTDDHARTHTNTHPHARPHSLLVSLYTSVPWHLKIHWGPKGRLLVLQWLSTPLKRTQQNLFISLKLIWIRRHTHTHTFIHIEDLGDCNYKALRGNCGRFTTPAVMKLNQSLPGCDALLPHPLFNIQTTCTSVMKHVTPTQVKVILMKLRRKLTSKNLSPIFFEGSLDGFINLRVSK